MQAREFDKNNVIEEVLLPGHVGRDLTCLMEEESIPGLSAREMGELLPPEQNGGEVD
jgi:hypothetical protein